MIKLDTNTVRLVTKHNQARNNQLISRHETCTKHNAADAGPPDMITTKDRTRPNTARHVLETDSKHVLHRFETDVTQTPDILNMFQSSNHVKPVRL